ncbi:MULTISPECIES: methyl-accepting chemotaxis protein [Clostridium]|uniref:methyl-accepting chemotaxis protein n=1 Tax=Clostridium TaxID=1485 RepID=UPI000B1B1D23|nr:MULTISPECIES: methyl-accepting chemotaxis protein [Clostridium]
MAKTKKTLGIKSTLVISFVIIMFITMSILSFIIYAKSKKALTNLGEDALRNRINMALTEMQVLQNQVDNKKLSLKNAQEIFRNKMLGSKNSDNKTRPFNKKLELNINAYMYAIDSHGVETMHPKKEGENISNMIDPKGNNIVKLIIDEGNNPKNNGMIHFYWKNPGETSMKPKTNAVGYFKPWNWYINVGAYDSDFYKPANSILNIILITAIFNLIIGSILIYIIISKRINPLKDMKNAIEKASSGNLKERASIKYNDEIGDIASAFNLMLDKVEHMILEIKESSKEIQTKSENLTSTSEELSSSTEEVDQAISLVSKGACSQVTNLSEVSELLNKLNQNMQIIYSKLGNVKSEGDNANSKVVLGNKEMNNLFTSIDNTKNSFKSVVEKINTLSTSINEIINITTFINEISENTNLLALNAAIEAARAGEAGKGFSVVSEKIRNLAEQTQGLISKINSLTDNISTNANEVLSTTKNMESYFENQSSSVKNAAESFTNILESIDNILPLIKNSYDSMNEISSSKDLLVSRVSTLNSLASKNSKTSEDVTLSSNNLSSASHIVAVDAQNLNIIANNLLKTVDNFKIS